MLLTDYTFVPRLDSDASRRELEDAVQLLLYALARGGQIWGQHVFGWIDGALRVSFCVPTREALFPEHHTQDAAKNLALVSALCAGPPAWRVLEDRSRDPTPVRTWQEASGLFLHTGAYDQASPIHGGTDNWSIPLYLLPIDVAARSGLWLWQRRYELIDRLLLNNKALEADCHAQLADPASELSQEGRALARRIEEATHLPTYYSLPRHWGRRQGEAERRCPGCGRAWAEATPILGLDWFDFRCDPCRLGSHLADLPAETPAQERLAAIGEWSG